MKKLPARIARKKEIYNLYAKNLSELPTNLLEVIKNDINFTTPWFIEVRAHNRDELVSFLNKFGIGSRNMYPPINKQLCYDEDGSHKVSEDIGDRGLWLPSSIDLTNEEIDLICQKISSFYR